MRGDTSRVAVKFVPGLRNSLNLVDPTNYRYVKYKSISSSQGETIYWKCSEKKNDLIKCPALATTFCSKEEDSHSVITSYDPSKHNHIPDIAGIRTSIAMKGMVDDAVANRKVKPRNFVMDLSNELAREGSIILPISKVRNI